MYAMPNHPCPTCYHLATRWLEQASAEASVNYYRCESCGSVFCIEKATPHGRPMVVLPGRTA